MHLKLLTFHDQSAEKVVFRSQVADQPRSFFGRGRCALLGDVVRSAAQAALQAIVSRDEPSVPQNG